MYPIFVNMFLLVIYLVTYFCINLLVLVYQYNFILQFANTFVPGEFIERQIDRSNIDIQVEIKIDRQIGRYVEILVTLKYCFEFRLTFCLVSSFVHQKSTCLKFQIEIGGQEIRQIDRNTDRQIDRQIIYRCIVSQIDRQSVKTSFP